MSDSTATFTAYPGLRGHLNLRGLYLPIICQLLQGVHNAVVYSKSCRNIFLVHALIKRGSRDMTVV